MQQNKYNNYLLSNLQKRHYSFILFKIRNLFNLNNINIIIIFYAFLLQICPNSTAPLPSNKYNYPGLDLNELDWREAEPRPIIDKINEKLVNIVDCYTQFDSSLINSNIEYRVNNSGEIVGRSCLLRLPTHTRLTIIALNTFDNESYVRIMVGPSYSSMPLTVKPIIFSAEKYRYGPYYLPCDKSYFVFNTNNKALEWVDFILEHERAEDIDESTEEFCKANAWNELSNNAEEETTSNDANDS